MFVCYAFYDVWEVRKREREKTCSRADWGRGDWVCVSEVFLEREGLISECCLLSGFERVRWRLHESMALPQWETLLMTILALSYFSSIFFLSLNKFFLFFFSLALASPCLPPVSHLFLGLSLFSSKYCCLATFWVSFWAFACSNKRS